MLDRKRPSLPSQLVLRWPLGPLCRGEGASCWLVTGDWCWWLFVSLLGNWGDDWEVVSYPHHSLHRCTPHPPSKLFLLSSVTRPDYGCHLLMGMSTYRWLWWLHNLGPFSSPQCALLLCILLWFGFLVTPWFGRKVHKYAPWNWVQPAKWPINQFQTTQYLVCN